MLVQHDQACYSYVSIIQESTVNTFELNTYDIIKAIPAKAVDWRALVDSLRDRFISAYREKMNAEPYARTTTDQWDAAKGVRQLREAAMMAAVMIVHTRSTRSRFIPPSDETKAWGGVLGGETVVWTDDEARLAAYDEVRALIDAARRVQA